MAKWEITIQARYLVDIDDLHKVREQITEEYQNPELPDFLGEENIEYLDGGITYELKEEN
jgi:hypothetical protein